LTEAELLHLLDAHDSLVRQCVSGGLSLDQFLREYNNFPFAYALDGHESGREEKELLSRHANRIGFHFGVMKALSGLCSEEEAKNPLYIKAGRFPPSLALQRLKAFADGYAHSDG
jgi:hypothetical protein